MDSLSVLLLVLPRVESYLQFEWDALRFLATCSSLWTRWNFTEDEDGFFELVITDDVRPFNSINSRRSQE